MKIITIVLVFTLSLTGFSQETIETILKTNNKQTIPYIQINDLVAKSNCVFLDTRESKEYQVSHIENAINVGFDKFKTSNIKNIVSDKNTSIVVYCSIGVRSEIIGEKLKKMGYTNVRNLYGGIFEWKNQGKSVVDNNNKLTENVHTFSKDWSVYLKSGKAVYEK